MENIELDKPELKTKEVLASEFAFDDPNATVVINQVRPEIMSQADEIVGNILSIGSKDLAGQDKCSRAIHSLGQPIQRKLAAQSQMLKEPMTALMSEAEDGGAVAKDLLALQGKVNDINPNRVDFSMGTVRRILALIPGVGTPMAQWFAKYQRVDGVIKDIMSSLKSGRDQLDRDNNTLRDDQRRMRELTFQLQDYISLAQVIDQKLQKSVESGATTDMEHKKFVEEEILFPVKQRILDLQQQLAVNQQGVLATEVIIRNNRELIIGVNRAINVTVTALNTAATLQIALQRQKKVLKGVQAVTDTTNDLIAGTAEQLKQQGTAIQKQASETMLDINILKNAFNDVEAAINDISEFRRNALPKMSESIIEMDGITGQMEKAITKMEDGAAVSDDIIIQLQQSA
ncbi:toxic anion resistance protein [Bacterioplanoides sp.]|uniref:toxic anion resistance protein n=1 Tax=Bacterioplanoides sp. TaxID=2066072 RepID=UPI003AFFE922